MTTTATLQQLLSNSLSIRTINESNIRILNAELGAIPVDPTPTPPIVIPPTPPTSGYPKMADLPQRVSNKLTTTTSLEGPAFTDNNHFIQIQLTNENTNPGMVYEVKVSTTPGDFVNATRFQASGDANAGPHTSYAYNVVPIPMNTPWFLNMRPVSGDDRGIIFVWALNPYPA